MKFDRSILARNRERAEEYANRINDADQHNAREFLRVRGIGPELRVKYKLGIADGLYDGWLSIPYLRDPHGVIWFNYRNLTDSGPKYKAPGNKHLYNTSVLDVADETGDIYICEGEFDALVATEMYGLPAVGVPGATQWTGNRSWHALFVGYSRIFVLADPDDAGTAMAEAIVGALPAARVVALPADVNDCWLQNIDIRELVK